MRMRRRFSGRRGAVRRGRSRRSFGKRRGGFKKRSTRGLRIGYRW